MLTLKIVQIGNSSGVVLPREALNKMKLEKGDNLYLIERGDGFYITPYDPEFKRQMKVARNVMEKDRSTLKELAKS